MRPQFDCGIETDSLHNAIRGMPVWERVAGAAGALHPAAYRNCFSRLNFLLILPAGFVSDRADL